MTRMATYYPYITKRYLNIKFKVGCIMWITKWCKHELRIGDYLFHLGIPHLRSRPTKNFILKAYHSIEICKDFDNCDYWFHGNILFVFKNNKVDAQVAYHSIEICKEFNSCDAIVLGFIVDRKGSKINKCLSPSCHLQKTSLQHKS